MQRSMRKPIDMKIHDYADHLLKINSYLKYFPTNTGERTTVLPNDEIMDILTYGITNTWQKKIVELSSDTQVHTPIEFVELCERISYSESISTDGLMTKPKANSTEKRKSNEIYAFNDDVCDQFNIDDSNNVINQNQETNMESNEQKIDRNVMCKESNTLDNVLTHYLYSLESMLQGHPQSKKQRIE
jgi:hypothetical protein